MKKILSVNDKKPIFSHTAIILSCFAAIFLGCTLMTVYETYRKIQILEQNAEVSGNIISANIRTLAMVQRELLRLTVLIKSESFDAEELELQRAFVTQRMQESSLSYQRQTLGTEELYQQNLDLIDIWNNEVQPQIVELISNPASKPALRNNLIDQLRELELAFNQLVTNGENNRKIQASKLHNTAKTIVRDARWLLGILMFTVIGFLGFSVLTGINFYQFDKHRAETASQILALHHETQKLSQVASRTNNLVIVADKFGYIEWVNDAFVRRTGFTANEVIGKRPSSFLQGPKSNPETIAYMRECLKKEEGFTAEIINYSKSCEEYWILIEVQPSYNEVGELVNFIAIETDITERKLAEYNLQKYARELERSNQELQDFAYIASHDLQEPLRKIQSFGDRLEGRYSDEIGERGKLYINTMQNAANRMQTLIEDLLDYSRVSTKAKPFVETNLNEVMAGVLSDLDVRINETGAVIDFDDLTVIEADPMQIRQLFQNLIGNALKFHKPHIPPKISVKKLMGNGIENNNNDQEMMKIVISDNGIGFDNKYQEKIFQIFQRLHGREAYQGTGVGLAICRKIVERHQGTLIAVGEENQGATFIVTLPINQIQEE